MNILVTGGAGYIGSFMTRVLINRGDEVTVLDNLERGHKNAVDSRAKLVEGNILNVSLASEVFSKNKFDAVIHFAGLISMEESVTNPDLYFENNVQGSQNIIETMLKNSVNKIIFSSTAGVYGNPQKIPIPEDHPKNPENPYGESKLRVEKLLESYRQDHNLNFVSLRYFNAAGASLDGGMGEAHDPETHIIPLAIKAALLDQEFYLYGTDYNTPDGTCVRDYIHVLDLVEAHLLALDKLNRGNGGVFYNVGTGKGFSNREVIEMVKKISGINFKVKERERRSGDSEVLIADPVKINKELRFEPKYSDLETIIRTAWEWHKNNSKIKT